MPPPRTAAQKQPERLAIHSERLSPSDLEITGLVARQGFVSFASLAALPQVSFTVENDENFPHERWPHGLRVSGVPLQVLAQAMGADAGSDLIDATCTDDYRAHYPSDYVTAHHPVLALSVEGQAMATWARRAAAYDPGPYFVTHARFVPAYKVLAHADEPQVPSNVIRLNFSTQAATYGAIAPRGPGAGSEPVQQGFAIAKQNCLRCHYQGAYGGTKSGRSWTSLGTWAREQPAFFAGYVRNPQLYEPHAHMPGNPGYDRATLLALTAYFQTFAPASAAGGSTRAHSSAGRPAGGASQ